ncbi:alpha/beta fold hydrolase [Streptomyces zaomyceticus]|uniref:alpha/beta fold hydrolase n=1 Tax=Streptomyces zaomyceticus TaxID=68286 RepID=UPI0037BAD079
MSPRTTPRRRPARRLPAALAGATAGALVVGLAVTPAHAGSGTDGPIGTVARTVGDARFRPGPCPRTADPVPDLARARCGTLTVPENRSRTKEPKASGGSGAHGGRKITLAVAIMPAEAAAPARDPIVWFAGGPGDDAVSEIPMALAGNLNRDRDVIFMSQRGTYSADPELTCPNIDEFNARALGLVSNAPSTGRLHVEATRACRDRVDARDAERSTYNDIESSADYDALRKTLGVKKWNVFGISYGTHPALNYMRLHPKGIRSVGIDGVLPPSLAGGAVTWKAAREGFDGLFKACEEQPACDNRYPNLKATFLRLVSELEADPVTTTVTVPVHPEPVKVVLDGGNLVGWLTSATHVAAGVPRSIDELAHGDPQRIAEQLAGGKYSPQAIGRVAHGLVHGVFCGQ